MGSSSASASFSDFIDGLYAGITLQSLFSDVSSAHSSVNQAQNTSYSIEQEPRKRQKRLTLRDQIRPLQELLPLDNKKMEIATVLEEAHRYIKFLEAQISAFEWMPEFSNLESPELLQLLVNSKLTQRIHYTQGRCVYSMDQMLLLKNEAERRFSSQVAIAKGERGSRVVVTN